MCRNVDWVATLTGNGRDRMESSLVELREGMDEDRLLTGKLLYGALLEGMDEYRWLTGELLCGAFDMFEANEWHHSIPIKSTTYLHLINEGWIDEFWVLIKFEEELNIITIEMSGIGVIVFVDHNAGYVTPCLLIATAWKRLPALAAEAGGATGGCRKFH